MAWQALASPKPCNNTLRPALLKIPISQMRRQRHKESNEIAQGHTPVSEASKL